ncbi:methionine gamma-lyase family protein, partial [Bacillus vallismortis]|nr:methionine gamma-lyase family protein [Bacillus vallismortis]
LCIGSDAWAYLFSLQDMYQCLFFAAHVVSQSLNGAVFTARFLEKLGFTSNPKWDAKITDLIQSVEFSDREKMIAFCQAIQY